MRDNTAKSWRASVDAPDRDAIEAIADFVDDLVALEDDLDLGG